MWLDDGWFSRGWGSRKPWFAITNEEGEIVSLAVTPPNLPEQSESAGESSNES
jgi:hypothetical protein